MLRRLLLAGLILGCAGAHVRPCRAQADRYELGRRVRVCEAAWDKQTDPEARKRATEHLKKAVTLFFGFRLPDAGRAMTDARFALRSAEGPTPIEAWAASLELRPSSRLIDATTETLKAELRPFYKVDGPAPEGARLVVTIGASGKKAADVAIQGDKWPQEVALDLSGTPEGDHPIRAVVVVGDREQANLVTVVSIVEGLDARREALRQTMANWPEGPTTDRETARALLTLLDKFAEGATLETDYPLSVLLKEAEAITAAQGAGQTYFDRSRTGQHWLTVALPGGGKAVARVQVPEEAVKGTKMPLVLALHGAGGSENLFFDAYGVGAIKRYCAERGWMLVAPRSNGMGGGQTEQLVDELARVYPIDRKKVLVVGHSMGAMQAVGMASRSPERYAAVAALGGGGMVQATPALSAVPFYVGVGTDDFALAGARGLHEALKRADVRSVSYHEFEAVEHLAIVQAALPEVFAFFDKVLGRPSR